MFYGCFYLGELNIYNFNTINVTNINWMFAFCWSLKELNISNFNGKSLKEMNKIFGGSPFLKNNNELKMKIRNKNDNLKNKNGDKCIFF